MVLAGVQGDAGIGQSAAHLRIACQRRRLVVVAGVHRLYAQLLRQRRDLVARPAVAHDQAGAGHALRGTEFRQLRVQVGEAVQDELHPAVGARQRIKDLAVEDEDTPDVASRPQRMVQRRMVVGAQVAAKPDQRSVNRRMHRSSVPQE